MASIPGNTVEYFCLTFELALQPVFLIYYLPGFL